MTKELPSPETLRKLLRYEPETGKLFWHRRPPEFFPSIRAANVWNARYAGKEALAANDGQGYCRGRVLNYNLRAHRVIFAIMTGSWPQHQVDHRDMDRKNNKWKNLREATHAENQRNRGLRSSNTSGSTGVSWDRRCSKWKASITVDRLQIQLGYFSDKEKAIEEYNNATIKFHGRFARHDGMNA